MSVCNVCMTESHFLNLCVESLHISRCSLFVKISSHQIGNYAICGEMLFP